MFVFTEIVLFRRLAIFGVQTADAVCFRCMDGQYRRHEGDPEAQVVVTEEEAFEEFFRGRKSVQRLNTVLPSKYRRRALSHL